MANSSGKIKMKIKRLIKPLLIIVLTFSWLLTGWPGVWLTNQIRFPQKISNVQAAPIALRGTAKIGIGSNGSDVTLTFDTGGGAPQEGDVVFLWGGHGNSSDANAFGPITAGYSMVGTIDSTGPKFGVWYKVMGATPDTQVQGEGGGNAAHGVVYGAYVIDGSTIDASIFDQTAVSTGQMASWVPNGPAINVQTAGAWVITHAAASATDSSRGTVSGYTLIPGQTVNETDDFVSEAAYIVTSSTGSEDPPAWSSWAAGTGGAITIALKPAPTPTTTLSTSSDPAAATVAPASGIRSAGQFAYTTSSGSDTITALTLTLAGSPAGSYAAVDSVSIRDTSCSGTLYFSAVTPSSDSVSFSGGTALSATTGGNTYYVCVTPKDHTLASGTYSVSPYVSSTWTSGSGNTKAGTDSNANALTIDNTAPNGATSVSGTAGNAAVTLNWTTSNSSDFNTTSGSVVYRWTGSSAGSEVPAEGSTPTAGATNGTATAACVISSAGSSAQSKIDGTGGSSGCTTTALTNGQAYTYKVFQKDNYGNYDAGVSIGSFTPTAASATFTQNKYLWYVDNDLADPTAIWGNPDLIENQAIVVVPSGNDPPGTGQELRLRVNYVVNTTGISISEKYFKLEYKAGTDGTCTTGSWTDVGTGDWVYATSGVTDGADIVKVLSDTTTGKGEEYVKSKPSQANHVAASAAEIIEYDFHIVGTGATANTQYSFRVVETNNLGATEVVFDGYTSCPTLITEPGTANLLRHGNVFTEGIEKGFFWVN